MPLFNVRLDERYYEKEWTIGPARRLNNVGLFIVFILSPAIPIIGIIASLVNMDNLISVILLTLCPCMLIAWIIVICTQFYYKPIKKRKK